jgi:hypothetical protein
MHTVASLELRSEIRPRKSKMVMDLEVQPASESDIDQLMDFQLSAFENDPYHEALYPGGHFSPEVRKNAGERSLKEWREGPR